MKSTWNEKRISRFHTLWTKDYEELKDARSINLKIVKEYLGFNYLSGGTAFRNPINLINMATRIHARRMAAKNPSVLVDTLNPELKSYAKDFQPVLRRTIDKMRYSNILQRTIKNAFFGLGITKIGLNKSHTVEIGGVTHDVGQPYAESILLDDLFYDTSATNRETCQYIGNRIRAPLIDLIESDLYDQDALRKMRSVPLKKYNETGDSKVSSIGSPEERNEEYHIMTEFWEVFFPQENMIRCIPVDTAVNAILREEEWTGQEDGPYHWLIFDEVPGKIFPLPPAALWLDIHQTVNKIFLKLESQADSQKNLTVFGQGDEKSAETVRDAKTDDYITLNNPQGINQVAIGGPNQMNMAFMITLEQMFSKMAGNLDALGGLGPQADTLGQDQLIHQSASVQISDMQDRVEEHAKQNISSIAFLKWHEPFSNERFTKPIPGTNMEISDTWDNSRKQGGFFEYNFTIIPYSMRHSTPESIVQREFMVLRELMPYMQIMLKEGRVPEFDKIIAHWSDYLDLPYLRDFFQIIEPRDMQTANDPSWKPPITQRNYTRRSIPGASNAGKTDVMARILSGGNVQDSEAQSIMRPTG